MDFPKFSSVTEYDPALACGPENRAVWFWCWKSFPQHIREQRNPSATRSRTSIFRSETCVAPVNGGKIFVVGGRRTQALNSFPLSPVYTRFTPTLRASRSNTSNTSSWLSTDAGFSMFHTANATGKRPLLPSKFSEEKRKPRSAV